MSDVDPGLGTASEAGLAISYADQTVVVTGAGRGLGRAYAKAFAGRGANVVVNDAARGRAKAVVDEIRSFGGVAEPSHHDVATSEGGDSLASLAVATFGAIDVLVHNAGFLRSSHLEDMTDEQIREVLDVHLVGAFVLARACWRSMRANSYGRIVLTSSSSTFGQQGNSNYIAAKAGVLGLTTALAAEGAPIGIAVNAVLPYAVSQIAVDSPLVGADTKDIRDGLDAMSARRTPESVVPLVLFLGSRECTSNGNAYSALAGRYARVFSGVTEGWMSDTAEPTAEEVAQHIHEIEDVSDFMVPRAMIDEIRSVERRLPAHDGEARGPA